MKKLQKSVDAWSDRSKWPTSMLNILLRAGVHEFVFGQFNFHNQEIHDSIFNYNDGAMKLLILGRRVYLDLDLVSRVTRIPRKGEQF